MWEMKTLMQFSEKEKNYHQYQARQNFIRQQETMQDELDAALAEKEQMRAENDALLAGRSEDKAEIARLKAMLEQQGKAH